MSNDTPILKPLTGQPSNPLTSCAEDSPVNPSALPASEKEPPMNDGSGLSLYGALAYYDRDTSSLKMCQGCLLPMMDSLLPKSCGTWPRAGTMRSGVVRAREPLAYLMCANESGFLPTPQASDGTFLKVNRSHLVSFKGNSYRHTSHQGIDGNAKMMDIAYKVWGGPLNPIYVEAMMGYPIQHTDCTLLETASSRKSSSGSAGKSLKRTSHREEQDEHE